MSKIYCSRNFIIIYHPKIKLKNEINPLKFLDTEIIILNNVIKSVHWTESKLPVPWESKFLSITNVTLH